jgi:uncharacterized membrane protein
VGRVLLIGESWFSYTIEVKGFDSYVHGGYEVGTRCIEEALVNGGHEFVHLPSHLVATQWSHSLTEFDLILLSDIGSNTFLLTPETFVGGSMRTNPLTELADYCRRGGGLGMIGGYLSFAGFGGRAHYAGTPIEAVLPVYISAADNRVEVPEGIMPAIDLADHLALGKATALGPLLGYNNVTVRDDAELVARCGADPLLALWEVEAGRSFAYTSDCGPHWAPPAYLDSPSYAALWCGLAEWAIASGRRRS